MKFTPFGNQILVSLDKREEKTPGGLFMPGNAREEEYQQGTVVAVGPGTILPSDKLTTHFLPMSLKVNDRVMFAPANHRQIKLDGEVYSLLPEDKVFGTLDS